MQATYFRPERLVAGPGKVDWSGVRETFRPEAAGAKTDADLRAVLNQMLDRLGETHFGVMAGDGPGTTRPATQDAVNGEVGIALRIVAGAAVVSRVDEGSSAGEAGVRPGWVLTDVNGERVRRLLAKHRHIAGRPVSRLDDVRQLQVVMQLLSKPIGETTELSFADERDRTRRVTLASEPPRGEVARFGVMPPMALRAEARTLAGNVGHFSLSLFLDPPRVMPAFDAFIKSHERASGLIIDVRGNPGGIGAMAGGMCGYLVDRDGLKLGTLVTRQNTLHFPIARRYPHYAGPVAVLVDGVSMSTSEILAAGLQDLGRARVFGQPTPGAALPSTVVRLPNGDRFQFAVADYISTAGRRLEGAGVTPDEAVPLTRASLLTGRDATLDAATRWIAAQAATRPTTNP